MRNRPAKFTMRKSAPPVRGEWFRIVKPKNAASGQAKDDITKVYILDEIGYWGTTAQDFAKQLMEIETSQIELHLNTPGGDMFDGLAIYNSLKQHPAIVTTYIDGLAASAGSFIALAAEKVIAARSSFMMIHDASAICWGNAADMTEMATLLDRFSDNIADIYSLKAGGDSSEWRELMKLETWYSGREAVDAGLADEVTDLDEELPEEEQPENKWDLSVFNHAGRDNAESPFRLRERVRLMNLSTKEERVASRPTSQGSTPEEQSGQQDPGTHEDENTGSGSPDTDSDANTGNEGEVAGGDGSASGSSGASGSPSNRATVPLVINGVTYNVPPQVASGFNVLNKFKEETIEGSRRNLVKSLATQNKIAATDIETTTAWALGLSDEQYDTWATMMSKSPASSLFMQHGTGSGDPVAVSVTSEIADLEEIIANHRRAGVPEDQIKTKASFIRLQELKSNNK